jgi:hypothetical protein
MCHDRHKAATVRPESPRAALRRIAEEVRSWPAYLRFHSSAYYESKGKRNV